MDKKYVREGFKEGGHRYSTALLFRGGGCMPLKKITPMSGHNDINDLFWDIGTGSVSVCQLLLHGCPAEMSMFVSMPA